MNCIKQETGLLPDYIGVNNEFYPLELVGSARVSGWVSMTKGLISTIFMILYKL